MAAIRERRQDEKCDYCYLERVSIAESRLGLNNGPVVTETVNCICSAKQSCRSTLCAYGNPLGGTNGGAGKSGFSKMSKNSKE